MGITALGWNNLFLTSDISANSATPSLPPENLKTDQCSPSTGWQTLYNATTLATGALFKGVFATAQSVVRSVVLVNTNLTSDATINIALWINGGGTPIPVGVLNCNGPTTGYRQVVALFRNDIVADFVQIFFNDPTNPDNNINIGGVFCGPLWIPATGADWNLALGRDSQINEVVTRGGQERPQLQWDKRKVTFTLPGIRKSELYADQQELDRISRMGSNVLFIPDITSDDLQREAIYGRLTEQSDLTLPYHNIDRRSWGGKVTERL